MGQKNSFLLGDQHTVIFWFSSYVGVELGYTVVLVSGVQQGDSVTQAHVPTLFQFPSPHRMLQDIEERFLCYTVGLADHLCDFW